MAELKDRYRLALVTGASSGLGLAFTQMLLAAGVRVIGLSREPQIEGAGPDYLPVAMDLSEIEALPERLDRLFAEHPEIDLVINNAGFGVLERLETMSVPSVDRQLAVMLHAPILIARRAIQNFQANGSSGCLVNVSSLAVELPLPLMSIYNTCKAGLSGLSDSLILDASGLDARYTVIDFRPGDFNTSFASRMEGEVNWNGINLREVMDHHHAIAPSVELAVVGLEKALRQGVSGRVRVGDFFQSKVAPLGPRLFPMRWLQALIRWYYKQ